MQNISYGLNEDCMTTLSKINEEWKFGNAQVRHLLLLIIIKISTILSNSAIANI